MLQKIASALRALGHGVDFTSTPTFVHNNEFVEVRSRQITDLVDEHLPYKIASSIHSEFPQLTIWLREWRPTDQVIRFGVSHSRLKKSAKPKRPPLQIVEIHPPY